jgi:hypothetical protein
MAEKSVGGGATRRRNIEPGRIQAMREIVKSSRADGVVASDRSSIRYQPHSLG